MGTVFGGSVFSGNSPDLVTATISAQDTWTAPHVCPGDIGAYAVVPVVIVITGGAVVTVQTKRPGSDTWRDYGDTAGVTNGGLLIRPNGTVPLMGGWSLRAGVKTGALGGGSAVVEIGTLATGA